MIILAVDPGSKESGLVFYDHLASKPINHGFFANEAVLQQIIDVPHDILAIEFPQGFGMTAGQEMFDTCWWAGRFCELQTRLAEQHSFQRMGRKEIKMHLCGHTSAKDKDVREALIFRFGEPGTKTNPGKLYGISGHCWAALAVAVTFADLYANQDSKGHIKAEDP